MPSIVKQITIHSPVPSPSYSSHSGGNTNSNNNNNIHWNHSSGTSARVIVRQQYIGYSLVLFNALFLLTLMYFHTELLHLVWRHWLLFAAYACSLAIAFAGIHFRSALLLWPLLLMTLPLIWWPTLVCAIFLLKLACPSILHRMVPLLLRNKTHINGTSNFLFHYECPPAIADVDGGHLALFPIPDYYYNATVVNTTTSTTPLPLDHQEPFSSGMHSYYSPAEMLRFATPGLLILTLIAMEKSLEFVFLFWLIRHIGTDGEKPEAQEEDIFAIEASPTSNSNKGNSTKGGEGQQGGWKAREQKQQQQKRDGIMKGSGSGRKKNSRKKQNEMDNKHKGKEQDTGSDELETTEGEEDGTAAAAKKKQARDAGGMDDDEDTMYAKGQFNGMMMGNHMTNSGNDGPGIGGTNCAVGISGNGTVGRQQTLSQQQQNGPMRKKSASPPLPTLKGGARRVIA